MNPIRIAICALAREEAPRVEPFVRHHQSTSGGVHIFDTGSEDITGELAAAAGASVCRLPQVRSYVDSCNAALRSIDHADWVIWLCLDEFLSREDLAAAEALIRDAPASVGAFSVQRYTYFGNGDLFCAPATRIFRNDARFSFGGTATESVSNSIRRAGFSIDVADLKLHHMGHVVSERTLRKKANGYVDNLEMHTSNRPMKAGELATYAIHLRSAGRMDDSLAAAARAVELAPREKPRPLYVLGQIQRSAGLRKAAVRSLRAAATAGAASNCDLILAATELELGSAGAAEAAISGWSEDGLEPMRNLVSALGMYGDGRGEEAADRASSGFRQNPVLGVDWWPTAPPTSVTSSLSDVVQVRDPAAREFLRSAWRAAIRADGAAATSLQVALALIPGSERGSYITRV